MFSSRIEELYGQFPRTYPLEPESTGAKVWGTLQGCLGYGGEEVIHIPRVPRLDAPGILHHVLTRGLERQQSIRDHIVWTGVVYLWIEWLRRS